MKKIETIGSRLNNTMNSNSVFDEFGENNEFGEADELRSLMIEQIRATRVADIHQTNIFRKTVLILLGVIVCFHILSLCIEAALVYQYRIICS